MLFRIIICSYVVDLLITDAYEAKIKRVKSKLMHEFEMPDQGNLSYFLEMEFKDTSEGISLHQMKYIQDILKRFKMSNCNAAVTPFETGEKLRKDTNDEFVTATLYK